MTTKLRVSEHAVIRYIQRHLAPGESRDYPSVTRTIQQAVSGGKAVARHIAKKQGVHTGRMIAGNDGRYYIVRGGTITTVFPNQNMREGADGPLSTETET